MIENVYYIILEIDVQYHMYMYMYMCICMWHTVTEPYGLHDTAHCITLLLSVYYTAFFITLPRMRGV